MNYSLQFCGDPFWDDFRPIQSSSSIPIPTECFSHTVLVGVPCLFFWLLVPILILQLKRSRKRTLPWSTLQSMKWLLATIILVDKIILLLAALWEKLFISSSVPIIDYIYPILQIVTFGALLVAKNECRRAGISSSGIVFCSWLMFAICGIPEFYAWIKIGSDPTLVDNADFVRYVAYLAYYPLVLLQLFILCFSDPLNILEPPDKCPEQKASFLNRQTMWWFSPLVATGRKRPLEVDDLFDLDEDLHADFLSQKWQREWDRTLRDYEIRKAETKMRSRSAEDTTTPLLGPKGSKKYGTEAAPQPLQEEIALPSIVGTLWKMFKLELLGASALKLVSDLLQFANPGFLNLLITWTEDPKAAWYLGIGYAVALFGAAEIRSLLMSNYTNESIRVATGIQTVLTTAVYDKTLRLSNSARRQKTQGEIVNLMAIDVDRFRMITPQLQQYWSSPMQIVICLFLLSQTIGYSVISGVVVMLLIIPVNWKVSTISKRWTLLQMRLKDERIRLSNEVLSGIKVVKLYAWEPALEKSIDEIRQKEMSLVRRAAVLKTFADMLNIAAPFFVALASFTTYVLSSSSHVLTPQVAFVSITLFNQLRGPLLMAADLVQQTIQCMVSNKRLKEFLTAEELNDLTVDQEDKGEYYDISVEADSALFSWEKGSPFQTTEVSSLKVGRGELIAVVGSVAAGKSSLLSALLGEMEKLRGYVGVRGLAAYVAQQPWIQNRSLKENILMDRPFDKIIYDQVLQACALKADLEQLPSGDMTEIGEKGINLSGGQKARVALARAVYQDRDVYLLDDPLSAVDAHVARHIFEHVIGPNGLLAKKTRILVTHGISFLKECDRIAVMKSGIITHIDTYDILAANDETADILKEADIQKSEETSTPDSTSLGESQVADDEFEEAPGDTKSQVSRVSKRSRKTTKGTLLPEERSKLIEKEKAETGRVKFSIYMDYFRSMGVLKYFVPFVLFMLFNSLMAMSRQLWLTDWSNDNTVGSDPAEAMPVYVRLLVYAGIGVSEVVFMYISMVVLLCGGVIASIQLHRPLLHNIMRSPLSYFDVTPLGRILNRLGKDIELVDLRLPSNIRFLAVGAFNVFQTCTIISISTPLFIAVIVPIFVIYILILRHFIDSSRQLQRLASLARSPIYSHFGDTIQGAATIRAFRWSDAFKKQNKEKLETYVRCSYFSMISNRWLSIRLELLGNIVILATALLAVLSKNWDTMSAGVIGLSVSYSLNITFMLNMFVRQVSEVETNIVAVERVREYTVTPTEASWRCHRALPVGWPAKGRIIFRDYSTRYRPGLDLVLKGLTLNVAPGQKIGVVGRTGAGKSSLALALFRIVEPAGGQILLDDVDIASIGLHDLRQNITIIPQDPVLFSGSLRFNLDPTEAFDDAALWSALEHSNLRPFVETLPDGLEHHIDEGGDNISVGQRQLVCLTRALLRKSRVLVLDEATAAVDQQTDAYIQATIRKEFGTSTVITIAHRLNTIMDYDKVLVMDNGQAAEFDSPQDLLNDKKSQFFAMAQSAKLV